MKKNTSLTQPFPELKIENVPELINILDKKLESLIDSKKAHQTSGDLKEEFNINIRDCDCVRTLIMAKASLKASKIAYDKEVKILKKKTLFGQIEFDNYKVKDFTLPQWLEDIDTRIIEITHKETVNKLNNHRAKLVKHLTEDMRLQSDLSDLAKDLGI